MEPISEDLQDASTDCKQELVFGVHINGILFSLYLHYLQFEAPNADKTKGKELVPEQVLEQTSEDIQDMLTDRELVFGVKITYIFFFIL